MSRDVAVICRSCGNLVDGVEAGVYVKWVECGCVRSLDSIPPRTRWQNFVYWLKRIVFFPAEP